MAQGLLIFSLLICWTLFACAAYDYLRQHWMALHHLEQAGAAAGADPAAHAEPAAQPPAPGAPLPHELVIEEVEEDESDGRSSGDGELAGSGRGGRSSSADEWTDAEEPVARQEAWPGSPASPASSIRQPVLDSDAEQPPSPASPAALADDLGRPAREEAWFGRPAPPASPKSPAVGSGAEQSPLSVTAAAPVDDSGRWASSAAPSLHASAPEGSASGEASVSSSPQAPPRPLPGNVAGPAPRWPPPAPLAFSMGQAPCSAPAGAGWPRQGANLAAVPPAWSEPGRGELRAPWSDPLRRPMSPERWQRWADGMAARGSCAPAEPSAAEVSSGSSPGASSERASSAGSLSPPRRLRRRFRVRPADAVPVEIDPGPAAPRRPQHAAAAAAAPAAGPPEGLLGLRRGWGALRVPQRANGAGPEQRPPGALPPAVRGDAPPVARVPAVANNRQGLRQRFGMRPLPRPDLVRCLVGRAGVGCQACLCHTVACLLELRDVLDAGLLGRVVCGG